ncbi:tRNA preQ1(34) S-adenosylmethionine ribosyltransferase-isomerase QueA [soil metagenome]
MLTDDFAYPLPEELIATRPAEPRDSSRLMVIPQDPAAPAEHRHFSDIVDYLRPDDLLVVNNSRVIPARLFARRETGGVVEILLLEKETAGNVKRWRALIRPARKIKVGERLAIGDESFCARVISEFEGGERLMEFDGADDVDVAIRKYGHLPLPPYILRRRATESGAQASLEELHRPEDKRSYQTVFAEPEGSVAAPTAGLHFTPELLDRIRALGTAIHSITLHVGAGTFQTMAEGAQVSEHVMHREHFAIPAETAAAITAAKKSGRRVISVGTTSTRALESAWDEDSNSLRPGAGSTNLLIAPGYRFRVVESLVTNFHLPRSTLLLLVSAMIGRERLLSAYEEAIAQRYRFFSYGDAMMISGDPGSKE